MYNLNCTDLKQIDDTKKHTKTHNVDHGNREDICVNQNHQIRAQKNKKDAATTVHPLLKNEVDFELLRRYI